MNMHLPVALLVLFSGLGGCANDYSLAPPANSKQVTVTLKVPEGASPMAVEATYLSDQCFPPQRGPFNSYATEVLKVKPKRQGDSDIYQAQIDLDGGSPCQWRLALVKVGVKYWRASQLGLAGFVHRDATASFHLDRKAQKNTWIVDDSRLSEEERTRTQVTLRPNFYPYVSRVGSGNAGITFLVSGDSYVRAPAAQKLVFEPQVHRDVVVRMRMDKQGERTYLYPDGSEVPAGTRWEPDVHKLDAIRLGSATSP